MSSRKKVIVVGIDGSTWSILAPRISNGELPAFQKVVSISEVGILQSVIPPASPPAWTSMFTGVNPGKHGIVDFVLRENGEFVPCWSRYRMCKTIWQLLSEAGRKCIVINDPATYPAEPINGIMTTGMLTPPGSANWIYPKELSREVNLIANGYECDIPPNFLTILRRNEDEAASLLRDLAYKVFRVSKYLSANLEWDVLATVYTTTDRLQHHWWHDDAEITKHYQALDMMLHMYLSLAEQHNADLIVVSDHGFGPATKVFNITKWLREESLAVYKEFVFSKVMHSAGFTRDKVANVRTEGQRPTWLRVFDALPSYVQNALRKASPQGRDTLDIDKSTAFTYPGAYGIFVNKAYMVDEIAKRILALKDEEGSSIFEKLYFTRNEMQGPYACRAGDLYALPRSPYDLAFAESEDSYRRNGNHRQEGIFIHYRPGSSLSAPNIGVVRPWDVAALILKCLNMPIPSYFDGTPKTGYA